MHRIIKCAHLHCGTSIEALTKRCKHKSFEFLWLFYATTLHLIGYEIGMVVFKFCPIFFPYETYKIRYYGHCSFTFYHQNRSRELDSDFTRVSQVLADLSNITVCIGKKK